MLSFSKEKGLFESNNTNWLHVDFTSDLHLDILFYKIKISSPEEEIENFVNKMLEESKTKEILVIAGDISDSNRISTLFLKEISKHWNYVLVVPGNHDMGDKNKSVERYEELMQVCSETCDNIVFLKDQVEIFSYSGIKFAGTFMSYNLHSLENYIEWKRTLSDKSVLSREFLNKRNIEDVDYYNSVVEKIDVFISHIPIVNLHGTSATDNLFLNVDVNPFKDILYISGHTHNRRNSISHSSNFNAVNVSYGYPEESKGKTIIQTILIEKK